VARKGTQWKPGVTFGIHPEVVSARKEPVILQKATYHFCPGDAETVKGTLKCVTNFLGGIENPDLINGRGCWLTVWHWHGGLIMQELNHQFSYADFSRIYKAFRENFL